MPKTNRRRAPHRKSAATKARRRRSSGATKARSARVRGKSRPVGTRTRGARSAGASAGSLHAYRFPGESARYRTARDRLLHAESGLRREIERVAALRRALPPGGPVREDYVFQTVELAEGAASREKRLLELFAAGKPTLLVYSFMYSPAMAQPCPSCTSILDGLDGVAPHAMQRVNLAVVAKSPSERIRSFAHERGWRHLPLLSSSTNSYNRDYHGETEDGSQWPVLNVFVKGPDGVRHSYATELLFAPSDAGQDPRHVDAIWPLWNLFDLTPEGRGVDWNPRLRY